MIDYLLALATVTSAWWLSTGVILLLNRRGEQWQHRSLILVTAVAGLSLLMIPGTSENLTALGALTGFGQGLALWAWLEMTYLMGVVTGPRKAPCPETAGTLTRFWLGLQTSLYHEAAVVAVVITVAILGQDGPNQVALATCSTLWLMRWSAKLNLFLGVRNYNSDWFPLHLSHLDSYTRRANMNLLFPVSVTLGSAFAALTLGAALATTDPFLRASNLLISALISLAVLEHWFLMYPFGESALWRWALTQPEPPKPLASVHPLPRNKGMGTPH